METPAITSTSSEEYDEEESGPELSESPGSSFSCSFSQANPGFKEKRSKIAVSKGQR